MQVPHHDSLGLNFQLVRRWIEDTQTAPDYASSSSSDDDDEETSNVSTWTFDTLLELQLPFLHLCKSVCRDAASYQDCCVYELARLAHAFLHHAQSSSDHKHVVTLSWALPWVPIMHTSSPSTATHVEILSLLVTITDEPSAHNDRAYAAMILSVLVASYPALLSTAPPPIVGHCVGASSFTGQDLSLPFVHQWLRLLFHAMLHLPSLHRHAWPFPSCDPSTFRRHAMAILAEEDDVLVDVLYHALRLPIPSPSIARDSNPTTNHTRNTSSLLASLWTEHSPAQWFADFCGLLDHDHLVLIDLVTSNETNALAYIVDMFRYVCTHWDLARATWLDMGRLDDIVSMLTHCRVELTRLERHAVVGFNVGPLVRRLVVMEQLFDGDDDRSGGDVHEEDILDNSVRRHIG
ncbi:hypothetical protein DYB37_003601 [Aphanomyces astaci]|uniref:Protein Lines N-terminal domain-containing protein n=1 Tax=Aphanomyces astaci TaxID=112090 RepID=A0A418CJJ6_APHAT|nr:hypothetical protein DYB35_002892 [Aphanomyces astaci]RHZ15596.1 hypothetical protein DYB37_003601 [Aphanomyces astaci]